MRLIDADAYMEKVCTYKETGCGCCVHQGYCPVDEPTVEAKEVVHGEWIYNEYYTWECGNCGFHPFKGFIPKEPGFNYCPNCGCDMREGNDVE